MKRASLNMRVEANVLDVSNLSRLNLPSCSVIDHHAFGRLTATVLRYNMCCATQYIDTWMLKRQSGCHSGSRRELSASWQQPLSMSGGA